ncbi:hydroxyacylglutathione hydrolase [Allomyces macrogynus ATCC 38327]|uniref:hydroxyacylglutathione hydrolase n=1 Tax=Allomyces macrogynus (strain ATCC 38327) TaxID=578462 RepID=A0A0L0SI07_ALLM3|nr:hydroxyacylglutathione hydrolase [Allomyces macrogynus ATCC 38327]|eukprot:KNE62158.1 hydroxyacylglutathione hydrolase [Allomyces macrogynus ATCC 38327]
MAVLHLPARSTARLAALANHIQPTQPLQHARRHWLHSTIIAASMKVYPVPCLKDNYAYVLVDETTGQAAVVDPVTPAKVAEKVRELGVHVQALLTTHHHWDHAGGNAEFVTLFPHLKTRVVGGDDRIGALTQKISDGATLSVGTIQVRAIATPCHTTGSISYYCTHGTDQRAVFTGDTLFLAGCGRFFEGTAAEMHASLGKLAQLPVDTKVYCGHEYTSSNLAFAQHVEPANQEIARRIKWGQENAVSVPGTIGEELQTNPFMRTGEVSVQQATGETEAVAAMGKLREMKNAF